MQSRWTGPGPGTSEWDSCVLRASEAVISRVETTGVAGVGDNFTLNWEETIHITVPQGTASWEALTSCARNPRWRPCGWSASPPPQLPSTGSVTGQLSVGAAPLGVQPRAGKAGLVHRPRPKETVTDRAPLPGPGTLPS